MTNYNPGDRIAYAAKFLKNIGAFTGPEPFRRGTFVAYVSWGSNKPSHARVKWDDIEQVIAAGGGQYDDPEYVADTREHGSLVGLTAIAKVNSPRFALNDL